MRIGIGDDACSGVEPGTFELGDGRADGHAKRAIQMVINPADGGGVPATGDGFGLADEGHGPRPRRTTQRRGRMQGFEQGQNAFGFTQLAADRRVQVLDVAQFEQAGGGNC